jgi:adenine nucleotide transporter 17
MIFNEVFSYEAFVHAVSGTAGGSIAMSLFYPLDIIYTHQQIHTISIQDHVKQNGYSSLYKGLLPVLMTLGISNFIYFYTNNLLKVILLKLKPSDFKHVTVMENLLIASISGVINVLITCPFWVANTRIKLQCPKTMKEEGKKPYIGLMECVTRIHEEEGMHALWNGLGSSLLLVSNPTINFVIYDKLTSIAKKWALMHNRKYLNSSEIFIPGAVAKGCATFLTYPIQLAQSRQRASKNKAGQNEESALTILTKIYRRDGILGWFAGMNIKLLQTVFTSAFQFLFYEQIQRRIFYFMNRFFHKLAIVYST